MYSSHNHVYWYLGIKFIDIAIYSLGITNLYFTHIFVVGSAMASDDVSIMTTRTADASPLAFLCQSKLE